MGVVLVTIFSNPMVDALTSLTDPKNNKLLDAFSKHGQHIPIPGILYCFSLVFSTCTFFFHFTVFYISFIVTPLCSNASEIVSSLIFASKQKKVTSSMTYSQVLLEMNSYNLQLVYYEPILPTALWCSYHEQHLVFDGIYCAGVC